MASPGNGAPIQNVGAPRRGAASPQRAARPRRGATKLRGGSARRHGVGGAHVRDPQRPQRRRSEWATWPNAVTLLRLLLTVPLCGQILTAAGGVAPLARVLVLAVLVLWAGSDWVDGFLARRWNQRSRVGEVLDPVADRLGILAVGACLAVIGQVPWGIVTVIVMTDVVVSLLAGRAAGGGGLCVPGGDVAGAVVGRDGGRDDRGGGDAPGRTSSRPGRPVGQCAGQGPHGSAAERAVPGSDRCVVPTPDGRRRSGCFGLRGGVARVGWSGLRPARGTRSHPPAPTRAHAVVS